MAGNCVDSCIFCQIIAKKSPANVIFENDVSIAFSDIRPAAKHHYLIVPKKHIKNAKELSKDDLHLLESLIATGHNLIDKSLIEETLGVAAKDNLDLQTRFGFHWPPFQSVNHLHLHVIFPVSDMSFLSRMIFKENSLWFVSPEYVVDRVSKL